MSTAAASGSSRSAGPWACRRPPTTSAPPAERSARRSRTSGCSRGSKSCTPRNYYAYGYRRTWKALLRAGETVGRDRVKRLMRAHGIQGAKRRGKPWRTTTPDPRAQRRPDLVQRDFSADAARRAVGRRLHLPALLGGRWCSSASSSTPSAAGSSAGSSPSHMRTDLVLDALRMALDPPPAGADVELVHHSDAGAQYTSYRITPRPSTITACWRRSGRSATPTTTRWPRASSTASRPS